MKQRDCKPGNALVDRLKTGELKYMYRTRCNEVFICKASNIDEALQKRDDWLRKIEAFDELRMVTCVQTDKIVIKEAHCGCVVEKHIRPGKLPLYVIVGQDEGVTENPFAAGANSKEYMIKTVLVANCPHQE